MTASSLVSRLPEGVRYYARGLVREFSTKDVPIYAQAIAFKALVSIVPLLLLATGITGRVLQRDRPFEVVAAFLEDLLPSYRAEAVLAMLNRLSEASGTITLVGGLGLLLSAISLMTTLRAVVSTIFREDYHKARSIVRGYGFDLRMVGQVGLLFVAIFAFTLLAEWVNGQGTEAFRWLGWNADWLATGWRTLFDAIAQAVPFLLAVLMFAQLYYFIPSPHPPRASVWRGALVTAVLWEISKRLFTLYAVRATQFNLEGSFGLMLALVFWVYYSGLVLCVGAIVVLLSEKRRRAQAGLGTRPSDRPAPDPVTERFDTRAAAASLSAASDLPPAPAPDPSATVRDDVAVVGRR